MVVEQRKARSRAQKERRMSLSAVTTARVNGLLYNVVEDSEGEQSKLAERRNDDGGSEERSRLDTWLE